MSITYKEKRKKVIIEETVDYTECELCGKRTNDYSCTGESIDWMQGYGVRRTAIVLEEGELFPEGGGAEITILDICDKCFSTKLIPWFKSLGGKTRTENVDW